MKIFSSLLLILIISLCYSSVTPSQESLKSYLERKFPSGPLPRLLHLCQKAPIESNKPIQYLFHFFPTGSETDAKLVLAYLIVRALFINEDGLFMRDLVYAEAEGNYHFNKLLGTKIFARAFPDKRIELRRYLFNYGLFHFIYRRFTEKYVFNSEIVDLVDMLIPIFCSEHDSYQLLRITKALSRFGNFLHPEFSVMYIIDAFLGRSLFKKAPTLILNGNARFFS